MNVKELKKALEDLDDKMEVRLMSQPQYPFEYEIEGVNLLSSFRKETEDGDDVLFILEGGQLGYGSKDAWNI